jgi:hypothetical protein
MGEATFFAELGAPVAVRPVTLEELKSAAREMNGIEGKEFVALLALRGALETRDELALAKAKERLEQVYRLREAADASRSPLQDAESRRKFSEWIAPLIGLPPEESFKHYEGLRPGPRAMENPYRLLSYEVSRIVGMWASVVLWWVDGKFIPAIYCFDMKTALYIHTFFIAPAGGLGFRICPYDGEQFFQARPNQEYCCLRHREDYRVARWRNKEKTQRNNGTKEGDRWHSKNAVRRGTAISLSTDSDSGRALTQQTGERRKPKRRN